MKKLSRDEMKKVFGGNATLPCRNNDCGSDSDCGGGRKCESVTCETSTGGTGSYKICGDKPVA